MTAHPLTRFLGVDASAGPVETLGLAREPRERAEIDQALRRRLEQVRRHPDHASGEADHVRAALRDAARTLFDRLAKQPISSPKRGDTSRGGGEGNGPVRPLSPREAARQRMLAARSAPTRPRRPAAPTHVELTEFDRQVLAVLVASGGWNARSRALLVALADAYGVKAEGLATVVGGLAGYARSGGPRLGVREITSGAERISAPSWKPPAPPEKSVESWTPQEREFDPWATIKLSGLAAFVTILLGTLVLVFAIGGEEIQTTPPRQTSAATTDRPTPPRPTPSSTEAPGRIPVRVDPARFQPLPTFIGNASPLEAIDAADDSPQLITFLEENQHKLEISDDPSEQVYQSWRETIRTISTGWVRVDESTRSSIQRAMFDVLYETAGSPSVSDRLLEALAPSAALEQPVDIWRGAWRSGMLAAIAASTSLPTAVSERARTMLTGSPLESGEKLSLGFVDGADAWLADAAESLVDLTEYDPAWKDYWEMWIAAQQAIGGADRTNAALLDAVGRFLETNTDLSRPGPTVQVIGRLLTLADFQSSAVVRDRIESFFDRTERIGDHDLWVLTSLLAQLDTAPWFSENLVLPPECDEIYRNRIRDRIVSAWPSVRESAPGEAYAEGQGIPVDRELAERWLGLVEASRELGTLWDDESRMRALVHTARLNHAAALLAARDDAEAVGMLDRLASDLREWGVEPDVGSSTTDPSARDVPAQPDRGRPEVARDPRPAPTPPPVRKRPGSGGTRGGSGPRPTPTPIPPAPVGRMIGPDGRWAEAYLEARRDTQQKLQLLQQLRSAQGSDLGSIDAEVFAREVYFGRPREVRSLAVSILAERFTRAPNIAMELLDQWPDAPRTEATAETIRRLTGRVLPSRNSESWPVQARLALVRHALDLLERGANPINDSAGRLLDVYRSRLRLLQNDERGISTLSAPHEAVRLLADAWQKRAGASITRTPTPDTLAGLERRRSTRRALERGPIQESVANQLSILEYLTFVTVAERPSARESSLDLLSASAARRVATPHVLEQAIEIELATAEIWALRMGLDPKVVAAGEASR